MKNERQDGSEGGREGIKRVRITIAIIPFPYAGVRVCSAQRVLAVKGPLARSLKWAMMKNENTSMTQPFMPCFKDPARAGHCTAQYSQMSVSVMLSLAPFHCLNSDGLVTYNTKFQRHTANAMPAFPPSRARPRARAPLISKWPDKIYG